MPHVYTLEENYEDIADAIRAKLGVQTTYRPGEMAAAISSISGGGDPTVAMGEVAMPSSTAAVAPITIQHGLGETPNFFVLHYMFWFFGGTDIVVTASRIGAVEATISGYISTDVGANSSSPIRSIEQGNSYTDNQVYVTMDGTSITLTSTLMGLIKNRLWGAKAFWVATTKSIIV